MRWQVQMPPLYGDPVALVVVNPRRQPLRRHRPRVSRRPGRDALSGGRQNRRHSSRPFDAQFGEGGDVRDQSL